MLREGHGTVTRVRLPASYMPGIGSDVDWRHILMVMAEGKYPQETSTEML